LSVRCQRVLSGRLDRRNRRAGRGWRAPVRVERPRAAKGNARKSAARLSPLPFGGSPLATATGSSPAHFEAECATRLGKNSCGGGCGVQFVA
jgi:hypothetical protein